MKNHSNPTYVVIPLVSVAAVLVTAFPSSAQAQCEPIWSSRFAGDSNSLNAAVNALAYFDDDADGPREPAIYAAGDFTFAGAAKLNHIARRDGEWWTPLGAALNGSVDALIAVESGHPGIPRGLYAAGEFSIAGGNPAAFVAHWDGEAWHALGDGPSAPVLSLALFDEDGLGPNPPALFGGTANSVSRWDGTSWTEFVTEIEFMDQAPVFAFAVFDEDGAGPDPASLFAAGQFERVAGILATNIARWNGIGWTPVGSGIGSPYADHVNSLSVHDVHDDPDFVQYLVAGGFFHNAGGESAWKVARWNGLEWAGLGQQQFVQEVTVVRSIDRDDNGPLPAELYVFAPYLRQLYRWDGSQFVWETATPIQSLSDLIGVDLSGDGIRELILGGEFHLISPRESHYAVWNGAAWLPQRVETGPIQLPVLSLLVADLDGAGPQPMSLFKSGGLATLPSNLTRFDGIRWTDIGFPLFNSAVTSMTTYDPDGAGPLGTLLVIGGTEGGHANLPGVATWDGLTWTPLVMTPSARVNALAAYEVAGVPQLFAATDINVRQWTGTEWVDSGGLFGNVTSLVTLDRDGDGPLPRVLVATGNIPFSPFGAAHASRFNGSSWSALGSQIDGPVDAAVAVPNSVAPGSPETLYAFAPFAGAPEPGQPYLLRWNNPAWELALPAPVGRTQDAIPYDAGGTMTILRGTGSAIEVLEDGAFVQLPGGSESALPVRALATAPGGTLGSSTPSIFAGGDFYVVGDTSSRHLAWRRGPEASIAQQPRASDFVAEGRIVRIAVVGDGSEPLNYQWRKDGQPLSDDGRITGSVTPVLTIDPVQVGDEGEYDAILTNDCGAATSEGALLIVTGSGCPEDIDGDRAVTLQDLAHVLARYGESMNVYGNEDIDADGQVNLQDLALLLASFGATCP